MVHVDTGNALPSEGMEQVMSAQEEQQNIELPSDKVRLILDRAYPPARIYNFEKALRHSKQDLMLTPRRIHIPHLRGATIKR